MGKARTRTRSLLPAVVIVPTLLAVPVVAERLRDSCTGTSPTEHARYDALRQQQVERAPGATIWSVDADGGEARLVFENVGLDFDVSPDGRHVAFTDQKQRLVLGDGAGARRILTTGRVKDPGAEQSASDVGFSPDGRRVGFTLGRNLRLEVAVIGIDGAGLVPVTHGQGFNRFGDWSGDGRRIAFTSQRTDAKGQVVSETIERVNVDGSNRMVVSQHENDMLYPPSWSPSGELAFTRAPHDDAAWIEAVQADGSGAHRVVRCHWEPSPSDPEWSPDGKRIVFHDGHGIAVIDADGSDKRRITDHPGDYDPTWTGDGAEILFSHYGHGAG